MPNKMIVILGMHRSGTSCLTGSLQKCGLFLGKHHTWNPHNKRGNRENADIVGLHDKILLANNGSWDNPPSRIKWQPEHIEIAKQILADYSEQTIWGFKDPRTLLTIEGWQHIADEKIQYIGIFRHPDAVANSLYKRSKITKDQAYRLWHHYNKRLLAEHKKHHFPILCFDWSEQKFHDKLEQALSDLGLGALPMDERFFTSELKTQSGDMANKLPWKIARLYRKLQKLSNASKIQS